MRKNGQAEDTNTELGCTPSALFCRASGVERGHFFITTDFNSELFRVAALGSAPTNNGLVDRALALVSWIAIPVWRTLVADRAIKKHRKEHQKLFLANQAKQ